MLWVVGSYIPLWMGILYNWARPPYQELENCYKYLLAKRAATCAMEMNKARFNKNSWAQSNEAKQLGDALREKNMTLYELENSIVGRIDNGDLK